MMKWLFPDGFIGSDPSSKRNARWLAWILVPLLVAAFASSAFSMNLSNVPPKFNIPWGNSAGGSFIRSIPQNSQIGIQNCAASLTDGFPPLAFQPVSGGGCAPFGQDFNGIFKQVTQWNQWAGAGATPIWDSAYSAAISGYPRGAVVAQSSNTGCYWYNTLDANTSNPDSGGTNWTGACPGGGIGTAASGGSANAQTITTTPFTIGVNSRLVFVAGFTNTGATTFAVNGGSAQAVNRRTASGLAGLPGGAILATAVVEAFWDGSVWELYSPADVALLNAQDQTLAGGANVTVLGDPAGNITVDCGARPLQWIPNNGPFTITAPGNDGSCMLQIENGASAGTIAFSGFTTNANTGEALDTVNTHKFVVTIWRIHSVASYIIKALQ